MPLKETAPAFQHSEQMCPNWQNRSKSCSLQQAGCAVSSRLPGALTLLGWRAPGQAAGGPGSLTKTATKGRDIQA